MKCDKRTVPLSHSSFSKPIFEPPLHGAAHLGHKGTGVFAGVDIHHALAHLAGVRTEHRIHLGHLSIHSRGIGAAVFSPLNQGLLTDRYLHGIPADSRAASSCVFLNEGNVTADILTRVRALNAMASARGETMAQLALAWVLENPAITTVITGASRPAQILQNVETVRKHVPLTDEEKAAIEKILG